MIKSKGIFAVSFIAMMVVGGAYANIASQGYVDQQVDAKQNASTAVKVATAGTAVGDATHPVYVNASGVATRIDKVAAAESADTATSATKATQDGNGANIANTYAKKTELPTVNNATLTIQKNGATVDTFTANASANKTINITVPTTTSGLTNDSGFITADDLPDEYQLKAATASALGGVKSGGDITVGTDGAVTVNSATKATQDGNGANIANTYAKKTELPTVNNATLTIQKNGTNVATFTANSANAATANITVPTKTSELTNDSNYATTAQVNARVATAQGTDNANDVMVVNSSGNVTPALITNANISSSAAIAQSKISGLTDALAGKLSTTGTAAKATADANGNNIANTYATKAQLTALDSTSSGSGAVVTNVSQTDGKVSVTKGNVQIPVGSATATSYATIWVQ